MGYPCCCNENVTPICTCCITNTAPESYRVTLTGVVEGSCGSCSDWNGTYDLEYVSPCYYRYIGGPCGPNPQIDIQLTCGFGFTIYLVRVAEDITASPVWHAQFSYVDFSNPSNCSATYNLPYSAESGTLTCNYTAGNIVLEPTP